MSMIYFYLSGVIVSFLYIKFLNKFLFNHEKEYPLILSFFSFFTLIDLIKEHYDENLKKKKKII